MVKQLSSEEYGSSFFSKDFELNERLERSVSTSSDTKLKIDTKKLKQFVRYLIWPLVIIVVTSVGLLYYGYLDEVYDFLMPLILVFAGVTGSSAFIIWLLRQSVYFLSSETTSYGVDKFEDPHEFEGEFSAILRALKNPRIVIVFDNLDRVTHDKVAEVLSTIKTFLEPVDIEDDAKEVVFLVPCDARSIKHHLENLYNSSDKFLFDSDEFLRKFFSTVVWIPDFIPVELESLAKDSLKETKVPILNNNNVAWLITKAFRENPRQIIQFVNILLANYLLVDERQGEKKDFPEDFLKNNVSQLTKYLILNQLFPDEMEVLRKNKIFNLKDIKWDDIPKGKKNEDFFKFIDETKSIQISNLGIFFTLRRSKQEKQFPGFGTFITLLEDRRAEEAREYIDTIGDLNDLLLIDNFSQAIKTEIENKTNPVSLGNLIATLFAVVNESSLILSEILFKEVSHRLNTTCRDDLQLLSPGLVDSVLFANYKTDKQDIVTHWIRIVGGMSNGLDGYKVDSDFITNVIDLLTEKADYLNPQNSLEMQDIINTHYAGDVEIAKLIAKNDDSQKILGSSDYINNFFNTLSGIKVAESLERLGVLNLFGGILVNHLAPDVVFQKFTEIVTAENMVTKNDAEDKQKFILLLNKFILKNLTRMSTATEVVRSAFITTLTASFAVIPSIEDKTSYMSILMGAKKYSPEAKKSEIDAILNTYITTVSADGFNESYSRLATDEKKALFEAPLYVVAEKRAITDSAFRDQFYIKITDDQRQTFIVKLFQQNIEDAFVFVEGLDSKQNKNIFKMFDSIWVVYDSASIANKKRMFDFVNHRKADNDKHVREVFSDKISACLTTVDLATQEVGLQGFSEASKHIAQPLLRKIIQQVFDWLRKPEVTPKYQPYALRTILAGYENFNEQEKAEFVQFIFDELLRKSTDIIHVNFGLELLEELKPEYKDRTQNFDDIKLRIEGEQNVDIKKALIEGLLSLKPLKQNPLNKAFWGWVIDQEIKEE